MPKIKVSNDQVIPGVEQASIAIAWLRPGAVQFRYCQVKGALMPLAKHIMEQDESLMDSCAKFEGEGDQRKRVETTRALPNGATETRVEMVDPKDFMRRRKELMEQETEIDIPVLLDFDLHIKVFAKEMVAKPPEQTVDFSLLLPFIKDSAQLVE